MRVQTHITPNFVKSRKINEPPNFNFDSGVITITIETAAEFAEIWHRLNCNNTISLDSYCKVNEIKIDEALRMDMFVKITNVTNVCQIK